MAVEEIIRMLENPATIGDALLLAAKLPFEGDDKVRFNQKRLQYIDDLSDHQLIQWVGQMKGFLSIYEGCSVGATEGEEFRGDTFDKINRWHHLDKQKMKKVFKRLWNNKKMVNVFFIERNPDAYAHDLHIILQTFCERTFETVCVVKMDLEYPLDFADAETDFAHFMHSFFDINVALMRNSESVQSRIFDTQVHFVVQSIDDFSYTNFIKYYDLWAALEPKEPLFLFFYVDPGSLTEDIELLENYCLCRYDDHEQVDGKAFQVFFSDPKSPLKNHNLDIYNSPPMTFKQAVEELKFCLKEQ
jgi:hypothetical protein